MTRHSILRLATAFLLLAGLMQGSGPRNRIKVHVGIAPLPSFMFPENRGGNNRSYTFGVSYSIRQDGLRLGVDFAGTAWASYYLYKFEKHLLYLDQEVGESQDLRSHFLFGFAPHVGWTIHDTDSWWYKTTLMTGVIWGWPDTPNETWIGYMGKPSDKTVVSPYILFQRPITPKLPIVGMARFTYVPGAGLISTIMVGLESNLLFWRE